MDFTHTFIIDKLAILMPMPSISTNIRAVWAPLQPSVSFKLTIFLHSLWFKLQGKQTNVFLDLDFSFCVSGNHHGFSLHLQLLFIFNKEEKRG